MEAAKSHNKWLTLLVVAVTGFLVLLDMTIVNITFPQLTKVFDIDPSMVLWVTLSYVLISTGLTPVFGRIGDMVGRKKIYIIGLTVFTLGLVVASLSQGIIQLIIARIIQGIGASVHMALAFAIVTDAFPENERGKALGINGSIFSIGPIIGPALGGLLVDTLGWAAIFYVQIPVAVLAIIMAGVFLRERRDSHRRPKLDLWGAGAIFISLSFFTLFLNLGGRQGFLSLEVLGLAAGSAIVFALFIIQETRTAQPIVILGLYRVWNFLTGNIALFILGMAASFHAFLFPFYLIDGAGYSASMAGLFLAAVPVVSIAIGPIAGSISDKIGSRWLCTAGTALLCLALFLSSRLGADAGVTEIIVLLGLFGLGAGLFITPNTSQVMGALPKENLGTGSAMINTLRQIGSSSGIAIAGLIFVSRQTYYHAQYAADNLDPSTLAQTSLIGGFQDALLIASLIGIIGVISSFISTGKRPV